MASGVEWPGFDRLDNALVALSAFDAMPLMERWADIVVEGNRRGVLKGVDGNNDPMPPLKYRDGKGKATRNRRAPDFGTARYATSGVGPYATGLHDNLTAAQYRGLTGPRLAPRRDASRVIKNLHTAIERPDASTWEVIGAWLDVVDVKGVPFLPFHFEGRGRNPRYDLRPVRPEDRQFAVNALRAFVKDEFFARF